MDLKSDLRETEIEIHSNLDPQYQTHLIEIHSVVWEMTQWVDVISSMFSIYSIFLTQNKKQK
jgi:hypothetical protein